ncbi:unnamed protein product [Caretta caretta]
MFLAHDPASGVHLGVEGGILCQLLRSPDYNLFPKSAVFESNFIQVTKQGNWVDIHNAPTLVTLGVTSSDPCLPLPNVLLIARLAVLGETPPGRAGQPQEPSMSLSRLLPLRYVRLSVQDSGRRLLRVQVVTGKVYYLRLHQAHPDAVFTLWSRLADILQRGLSITTKDPSIHVPHSLVLSVGSSSTSSPAQAWCQIYVSGAHLASIHSEEEHKAVAGFIARSQHHDDDDGDNVWIGLSTYGRRRRWSWTDDSEVDFDAWDSHRSYSFPSLKAERCLALEEGTGCYSVLP